MVSEALLTACTSMPLGIRKFCTDCVTLALESTTSSLFPCKGASMVLLVGADFWLEAVNLIVKQKVEPCCQTLCTVISPPIISLNCLLIAKPNPVPPC